MTDDDVRAALTLRWPDAEYLSVDEAPQKCDRGGRKIDRLVLALWRSRGLERDAVEIKVSISDWTREVKNAAKADWWWRHVHRFWVAVPEDMAARVAQEIPPTWGLLSCSTPDSKPTVVVQAPKHDPEPFEWPALVGIMRAASDCGVNALMRARSAGYREGKEAGESAARRASENGLARSELEQLRERVKAFEDASGLDISHSWPFPAETGRIVKLLREEYAAPGRVLDAVERDVERVEKQAEFILEGTKRAREFAGRLSALAAEANGESAP